MKFKSIHFYFHYNPNLFKLLFYIIFNSIFLLYRFNGDPTFFWKYQIHHIKNYKNITMNQVNTDQTTNKQIQNETISNISQFPIDLVYTWVDGRDPKWLKEFSDANKERGVNFSKSDYLNRFVDIDDLRYSLRSVEKNMPFIRYIFIVTWDKQHPNWLNLSNPRIKIVSQSEIFPKNVQLPTFNSKSIDFSLYKIPGLAEHFIYSNDDMYFSRPLNFTDFFTIEGKPIIYSKQNNWSHLQYKYKRFDKAYKKTKNDGFLFMVSMFHTVLIFAKKFNKIATFEYSHIPIPFTKKICEEAYLAFKGEIDETISHRFRSKLDLQMQTLLIQFGLTFDHSVVKPKTEKEAVFIVASKGNKNYRYIHKFLKKMPKLLSINIDDMRCRDKVKAFLDCAFDEPASFELLEKPPTVDQDLRSYFAEGKYNSPLEIFKMFYSIFYELYEMLKEQMVKLINGLSKTIDRK